MEMIQLNDRWRVVESDYEPKQWLLQHRRGKAWESVSYCQSKRGLLTAITEKVLRASEFYPHGGKSMPVEAEALDMARKLFDGGLQRETGVRMVSDSGRG
jgi:hypothetical protein